MPLRWKSSPLELMVVCVAEGTVTLDDFIDYLDALEKTRALGYQKILVAASGRSGLTAPELGALARALAALNERNRLGAIAIVTGSSGNRKLANVFRTLTSVDRPVQTFTTIHNARLWLSLQADPPSPSRKS